MPAEVTESILFYIRNDKETMPGIASLTAHLLLSLENRASGCWKNIPRDVFIATMGCFSRFVKEHKCSYHIYGYDRAFWTLRQANAKLFRLGELEYERMDRDAAHIHIHIPSDAKLEPEKLNDSIHQAKEFFTMYFPENSNSDYMLETWLLSPELKHLLPPDSRILHFQDAFDITETDPMANDYLEWVFKIPGEKLEAVSLQDLPEDTTLQKNMKQYILNGGHIGNASGTL
ncbi:MAG: acyltransferase domain-containing protein, partial [Lachnospiraceae bacterium]|nr:acyltransferase domain-containing protein [Lachnospiraceae bacterium]